MRQVIITDTSNKIALNYDINAQITAFERHISHTKALSTVKTYSKKLKLFVEWFTTAQTVGTIKEQLESYRSYVGRKYKTAKSRNVMLSVVRSFYKWLFEHDYIDHNPTALLKNFADSSEHGKSALSDKQLHDLFAYLRTADNITAERNRAMIILTLQNGLRVNEVANIKIEDFSEREGDKIIYLLRKGYTDKSAYTILTDETYELLQTYLHGRTDGYLFANRLTGEKLPADSISRVIKGVLKRIGIDDDRITAHSLRHSAAVAAYKNGATVYEIMKMLNHKNISTTQIYIDSLNRHENSAEKKINFAF